MYFTNHALCGQFVRLERFIGFFQAPTYMSEGGGKEGTDAGAGSR